MRIPYGRQTLSRQDLNEIVKVLKSDWITQGPKIQEFEQALAEYCGAKYAVTVSSGTAALHLAVLVSGIKKREEIITSPITFLASANCILYCKGRPVFADIQKDTINIDPLQINDKVARNTRGVIPVHFAGRPCEISQIKKIADKNKLFIIEDACHALGAEYRIADKWMKIGNCKHSDMAVFSFHPVKTITTGEGGAITTNNEKLYESLMILRNHGITKDSAKFTNLYSSEFPKESWYYEMQYLGFNYRITDMQSALGISQLKRIDIFLNRRREIASIYNRQISKIDEIELPAGEKNSKSAWHLYIVRVRENRNRQLSRNKLFSYLRKSGIGVQLHYIPVYFQPYYYNLGYKKGLCPKAKEYYKSAISLPIYPALTDKDVKYVTKKFRKFFC